MSLLEVNHLTKRFGGLLALSNLDFTVAPGEIVGIIGPNGAGKTTLFNCMTGFLKADTGSVVLAGENVVGKKPYELVGKGLTRTWQLVRPFFGMRVIEAMRISSFCGGFRSDRMSPDELMDITTRIAESVGLADKLSEEVDNLNQGELRLLDISRALVSCPRIVLLDEPFSGLSHKEVLKISQLIGTLNQEGLTVLIIEHRLRELMRLVNKVVVINFGRKIAEGTPEQVVRDPAVIEAYLGRKEASFGLA